MTVKNHVDAAVRRELEREHGLDLASIHPLSDRGIVTLIGMTPTLALSDRAEKAAVRAPGVRAVVNELLVREASPELSGVRLAEATLGALKLAAGVPHDRVKVIVRGDLVKLVGELETDQRQAALIAVRAVPGVKHVVAR